MGLYLIGSDAWIFQNWGPDEIMSKVKRALLRGSIFVSGDGIEDMDFVQSHTLNDRQWCNLLWILPPALQMPQMKIMSPLNRGLQLFGDQPRAIGNRLKVLQQ